MLGKRPSVRGVAMNPIDHPHEVVKVKLQAVGLLFHLGLVIQKVVELGKKLKNGGFVHDPSLEIYKVKHS